MDLITTHNNADFDALASLVAAKKLYPDSRLLLPGSQEEAVREFLSLARDRIAVESEKECRLDDVERLVLVDTRHRSRIGIASTLLDKGVEIHIYDHHPRMKGDIAADLDVYEEVGATVSILADIIKKKRIRLSYLEATLMLIGIYEETGSLTYRATTKLDVDMVSFLLSQGASLSAVSSYLNRELSEAELSLFTRLINSTERVTVKGLHISFITLEAENYVGELGALVHKLMEIENIPALFVIIKAPHGRVDIIARSRVQSLDVNKVMSHFGGGGHPGASSAKIYGSDEPSVKRDLISILKKNIRVTICAGDIMSASIKPVDPNDKVEDVRKRLVGAHLSGLPVVRSGVVVGIITLIGLNKAVKSGFNRSPIKGYMMRKVITVKPDTPLYALRKLVFEKDSSVIPVIKDRKIFGVVTRTDILRNVHEDMFKRKPRARSAAVMNISKKMDSILPGDIVKLLKKIGRIANSEGCAAFIVGGMVRDILLGEKNLDLDVVVEREAIKLGHILARELKATIVTHRKFGTCSLYTKDKLKIDLATSRKETYEKPAALPTVRFSSLKDDLIRRDFTINAMAVSINAGSFGQLIDFFGGQRDLERGRIKVLHEGSFMDDPTRIFRAVRFETRFSFAIDVPTGELIKNAIEQSMFEKVEPQRVRDELILILKEASPLEAVKRMSELDELRFIHPELKFDSDMVRLYYAIEEACQWYERSMRVGMKKRSIDRWLIYLMALFDDLSYNTVSAICGRFVFRGSDTIRILSAKSHVPGLLKTLGAKSDILPSRIYRSLEPLSFEVALFLMAKAALVRTPSRSRLIRSRIKDFFQRYNGTRPSIKGDDIKALGLRPSPKFKTILRNVLYARIDGRLRTRSDELGYIKRFVGKKRSGHTRAGKLKGNRR